LQGAHLGPVLPQRGGGLVDLRFIRGDQKVVAVLCTFASQVETDTRRGAGYDG
jgi:hypothetical protein